MLENDDFSCLLAVEEKPNSFLPIDLKDIGINNYPEMLSLAQLDAIIANNDIEALKESIKNANIIPTEALQKNLIIIAPSIKRKYKLITREILEEHDLTKILYENINDKDFVNRIINKLYNLNISDDLIASLKEGNLVSFFNLFNGLSYVLQRNLYLYIINCLKIKKNKTRKRNKNKNE